MHSNSQEDNFRRYLHVDALVKHFSPGQRGKHRHVAQRPDVTRTLIEQSSRSQAGKWRNYAKAEDRGPDCPSRPDAA